jgi:hypothetical protein
LHGRTQRALSLFDKSIALAKAEGFVQDEGLTYERLAQYNCILGNFSMATLCYECAREAYSQWGAQALADRQDKLLAEYKCIRRTLDSFSWPGLAIPMIMLVLELNNLKCYCAGTTGSNCC